ncbi:MAG: hypothetical protein WC663_02375 [Patescibacteria group bacterium]|jgi:hypothetical protein
MPNPEQPMQEKIADVKEPQQKVEGLEIAKTEELKKVVAAANVLAEKIERNENVTAGDVLDLKEALGQVKFDFYGDPLTSEEIKKIPNLQKNIEVYKGIKAKKFLTGDLSILTYLPVKIAETIKRDFKSSMLFLNGLTSLSEEAANNLKDWLNESNFRTLSITGITSLSPKVIQILAQFKREPAVSEEIGNQIDKYRRQSYL